MKTKGLIGALDEVFPFSLALSWDNSGLQAGDPEKEIGTVAVALDPALGVVEAAWKQGVDCVVTHHPLLFKPLSCIDFSTPAGRTVLTLVQNSISLVSLHTNLDVAPGGLADHVAGLMGMSSEEPLLIEEGRALGRVGTIPSPLDFAGFLDTVKDALKITCLRVVNPPSIDGSRVWRVALCPGSGGDLVHQAASVGAQVYVTGDLKYHQAMEAVDLGLTVVDAGHYGTEMPAVDLLVGTLKRVMGEDVSVIRIESEDPFKEELL